MRKMFGWLQNSKMFTDLSLLSLEQVRPLKHLYVAISEDNFEFNQ